MQTVREKFVKAAVVNRIIDLVSIAQVASIEEELAVILRGEFYLAEECRDGKLFWLRRNGEIVLCCPYPESLVALKFRLQAAPHLVRYPVKLKAYQGTQQVWSANDVRTQDAVLYLSLIEGMNPITFQIEGALFSPYEADGFPDARRLSFGFSQIRAEILG